MPRKPGPMHDLVVEGLSSGEFTRTIDKVNDWDGKLLPIIDPPRAGDLRQLAKAKAERTKAKVETQAQRTTQAMNKALSVGMPSQFAQPEFKPFKRRV